MGDLVRHDDAAAERAEPHVVERVDHDPVVERTGVGTGAAHLDRRERCDLPEVTAVAEHRRELVLAVRREDDDGARPVPPPHVGDPRDVAGRLGGELVE